MNDTLICRIGDVPAHGIAAFETAGGDRICIARDGERWLACQAACPHQGAPLCEAHLEGGVLTCLEHLWQWDLRAAGAPRGRAEQALAMYDLRRIGDELHLARLPASPAGTGG